MITSPQPTMPASVSTRTSADDLWPPPVSSHCWSTAAQFADRRWVVTPVIFMGTPSTGARNNPTSRTPLPDNPQPDPHAEAARARRSGDPLATRVASDGPLHHGAQDRCRAGPPDVLPQPLLDRVRSRRRARTRGVSLVVGHR